MSAVIDFPAKWLEIPVDEKEFIAFMKQVDALLAGDAPAESETCQLCNYRHQGETISHHIGITSPKTTEDEEPF